VTGAEDVAVVLAAAGGLLLTGRGTAASARLRSAGVRTGPVRPGLSESSGPRPAATPPAWLPRLCGIGAAVAVLAGRGALASVLVAAALAGWLPGRRAADARDRVERATARDLPRVADLLATCLEAGLSVPDAADVVGTAVTGPLGTAVRRAGAALRAGADPHAVWSDAQPAGGPAAVAGAGAGRAAVASEEGPVGPGWSRLAAALERGSASGAPLAGLLRAVADDERDRARWAAEGAAARAGVRAIGPLVACFLPAFVLVGVVPVVVGIAGQVVAGLG
jgi:pilus assembly protein TadC